MKKRSIYIGSNPLKDIEGSVQGEYVDLDGERFYKISNVQLMPDFFISIVSASDHWMFISSNGSLSAGRKNSESSLFPYYTVDKIHDFHNITGSKTLILADRGEKISLWEPFSKEGTSWYKLTRNLYKNQIGNKLIFEEINEDLSLAFSYAWCTSDRFGFVKNSKLRNTGKEACTIEVLDGLQNILPAGVDPAMQSGFSSLMDAYKRNELEQECKLGIFRLSSIPVDTVEPSESLRVNTVWTEGLEAPKILLSSLQVNAFKSGYGLHTETDIKAEKGAYLVNAGFDLSSGSMKEWNIVAEVNQDAADLAGILNLLKLGKKIRSLLQEDISTSTEALVRLLASSDALQLSGDELCSSRHLTNVLFNIMRGGLFDDNYLIQTSDLRSFVGVNCKKLEEDFNQLLKTSKDRIDFMELLEMARHHGHPDVIRACYEYLPLTFSRRHGDPSRPWNKFSIDNRKGDGSKNLDYQGNWRDIFQNWEALGLSYPEFVESMICKFVNASTMDGYNPYRITRNGIDWEVPDPSDPWSNIGYWGDHQIVYLLKLLEISYDHHPGYLQQLLRETIFCYANVPYRIKSYDDLLKDPHSTIEFDQALELEISNRVEEMGSDGKLVQAKTGSIVHVNLAEKLLVPLLSKLSNFVPGAGIWMNTQRPEWNDANNALVGYGVSMVTSYQLRAFLAFCRKLFNLPGVETIDISEEVADLLGRIYRVLEDYVKLPDSKGDGKGAKTIMDGLGRAGSDYRQRIYHHGLSGVRSKLRLEEVADFLQLALESVDLTIAANRRKDKLFHSYNLISLEGDERIHVRRLYEMLEGQVAIVASGFLSPEETLEVLDALKASKLYRADQYSYILYPNRDLPTFLEKNNIPAEMLDRSELLKRLIDEDKRQIVTRDVNGNCHFNGNFRNAGILREALESLPDNYKEELEKDKDIILQIYEELFDHQSFTGRSGTFYGYEGLGSIYWHMVSKLLLAVWESYYRAHQLTDNKEIHGRLAEHYFEIRAGIGLNKNPKLYGAFPTDPYSHTPGNRGAQQPGMTGQVKEDIISRWGELGVKIMEGKMHFIPILLRKSEFLNESRSFQYKDISGEMKSILLEPGTLAFTYCQVPVIYRLSNERKICLYFREGPAEELIQGDSLNEQYSSMIFRREGKISLMEVWLNPA